MVNNEDRNPGSMVMISRRPPHDKGRLGESSGDRKRSLTKEPGEGAVMVVDKSLMVTELKLSKEDHSTQRKK